MSSDDPILRHFYIGGENLLGVDPAEEGGEAQAEAWQEERLSDIRIRIGTLLKAETVSFLLGAGASVDCGGQLIGSIPIAVERRLHEEGISGGASPRVRRWLRVFYLAVRRCGGEGAPNSREAVVERRKALAEDDPAALKVNLEELLALLHRWLAAIGENGTRLRLDGTPTVDASLKDLETCIGSATRALARTCDLPAAGADAGLRAFKIFVRKVLTRPLNLKRVNVFTLNYDTLVEQAADAEGVVLLDGFVGTQRRVFRPESYEQDLYFPAETTEGRVHRFDRVLHLYKLHGSITWVAEAPSLDNPYGVRTRTFDPRATEPLLIYPTPAKSGEALGMPYAELFRRFATALVRPQSVLFVIGYGFGDEHVNAIIRQALAVPSFTLVIVDPAPQSEFVQSLREQDDQRVWIVEGSGLGTFDRFVSQVLPDLRDEDVRKKVLATRRALDPETRGEGGPEDGD